MMVQTLKSKNYVQCKCVDEIIAEMLLQQQPEELDRRTAPPVSGSFEKNSVYSRDEMNERWIILHNPRVGEGGRLS